MLTRRSQIAADIDGIVIRGAWRARVELGPPDMAVVAEDATLAAIAMTRSGTTLTVVGPAPGAHNGTPELRVRLARIRGIATSGNVELTILDRSDTPLFLDLAGTGTARATGSVPLLRVTTSGSVAADLLALTATAVRVHARQASRLEVRAKNDMTIVALDAARVSYAGAVRVRLTSKASATITRI